MTDIASMSLTLF